MTQTLAIFVDAYRELNSKRLFWITLMLSGLVVGAFACVGINEKGMQVLVWDFPFFLNSTTLKPETFYKVMFSSLGIGVWLAWAASILALISTAGIFPDLVSSGSIELMLSKPISRARLFVTKYLTGLLFVALQVTVFSAAAFLVIGIRGDAWVPSLFLAVPIVVLFFSYLFCLCTLIGIVTRSTIAALLLTLLGWLFFFGLNATDTVMVQLRETAAQRVDNRVKKIEAMEKGTTTRLLKKAGDAGTPWPEGKTFTRDELEAENALLKMARAKMPDDQKSLEKWRKWSTFFFTIKTFTPKTAETIGLLERHLISPEDLKGFKAPNDDETMPQDDSDVPVTAREIRTRTEGALRERSVGWIVGTSLAFEAVVLGIAGWIFCRRDF